jgi:hypothetical protein
MRGADLDRSLAGGRGLSGPGEGGVEVGGFDDIETSPPAARTTVADDAGRKPATNTQAPARSISAVSSAV